MKLALEDGDRPTQGKCMCCFADIHRNGNDLEVRLTHNSSRADGVPV